MWRFWAGWAVIGIAMAWFAFKISIAYAAARRPLESGGVPTLDGALFPPLALAVGVGLLEAGRPARALAVWIAATAVALIVHLAIARLVPSARR